MPIKTILNNAHKLFAKHKIDSAILDAELLLIFVINKPREFIYTHPEYELSPYQIQKFNALVKKRCQHIPIAYLTHSQEFFGFNFWLNKNVLIPRPESEILVEQTILLVKKYYKNKPIALADIGTGSGCLTISLAKNISDCKIHATDISKKAIYIARKNSASNHVKSKIIFHLGNLLTPIKNKKCDIIVANLPYVPSGYSKKLNFYYNQGLKFEPSSALYSGPDGLKLYRSFFAQIKNLKYKPRFILIEIDPSQIKRLKIIIAKNIPDAEIKIIRDLNRKNRFLQINL